MSVFAEAVRGSITERVRAETEPRILLDLVSKLPPTLVDTAVRTSVARAFVPPHPDQEAEKFLTVYPPEVLLAGDQLLEDLDLVGTPNHSLDARLNAITALVDLNKRFRGNDNRGLLEVMQSYGTVVPLFHSDLQPTFDYLAHRYDRHPRLGNFRDFLSYHVRDGILDVSGALIQKYGVPFDPELHNYGFGISYIGAQYVLPGVGGEEYLEALCSANLDVANSTDYGKHIEQFYLPDSAPDWKTAIDMAKQATIAKSLKREDARTPSF